ncbi:MAG TPA: phosphotransferase [Rhizobiaceae bacterium]|nr:phosphotransferase [Rhizobiaceae bacterium]
MAVLEGGTAPRVDPVGASRVAAAEMGLRLAFPGCRETLPSDTLRAPLDQQASRGVETKLDITAQAAEPGVLVPSHRGMDSSRLLLSVGGHAPSMMLKVIHPDQSIFFDAETCFDAQRKAAALGCAPDILAFDIARAAWVSEFLDDWATARVSDLKRPELLNAVIEAKKKIHAGSRFKSSWSVFDRIRMLRAACASVAPNAPEDLPPLLNSVSRIERIIASAGLDDVPAHADGLASNILIGPNGRVQLVDFDEARNVDPYYEIALLANEVFENEKDYLLALEMFDGSARLASFHRIRLYAIADDLAWALWGIFMDATSPRKDVEFYRYACWRLIRCRIALQGVDLDQYARSL